MTTYLEISPDFLGVSMLAFVPGLIGLAIVIYMWGNIPKSTTTIVFLIFVISCILWQISEGFLRLAETEEAALFWNRCISLSIMPAIVTGLHFSLLFTNQKKILRSKLFFFLVYCPAIYFSGSVVLNINSWQVIKDNIWNWKSDPNLNTMQSVETFWVSCIAFATMFFLAKYALESRKSNIVLRRRSLLLFIGYLIPSALGVVCQIIFPLVFGIDELPIAAPAIIFFSIASLIALKKYKLFWYSASFPANRILKKMNEAVLIIDTDLNVRYANCGFSRLTGYSRKDLTGRSIESLGKGYVERDELTPPEHESETAPGRKTRRITVQDGSERVVFFNSLPYIDKSGEVSGTILLYADITEIVKANEKIKCEKRHALKHQSMLLSSQLNPHFIYNSLNSIQYYVLDENREPTLNYISDFSKLMRNVLDNSLKDYICLSEEILFLQAYLNLELRRLQNKFRYEIRVSEEIDTEDLMIPPMLLQPFVENSIVHGIGPIQHEGILAISFSMENGRVICEIKDNGSGRENGIKLKEIKKGVMHKSHGMNLIKTRIDLLNEISRQNHLVEIEDLKNENNEGIGTKILVSFPCVNY